jgi:hypothetical protein
MHSEDGHLYYGGDINNHGEIVGIALDLNAGTSVAFLAVPTGDGEDCEANPLAGQRPFLPENVRQQLQQQHRFRPFAARK